MAILVKNNNFGQNGSCGQESKLRQKSQFLQKVKFWLEKNIPTISNFMAKKC